MFARLRSFVAQGLSWVHQNEKIAALLVTNVAGFTVGLTGYYRGTQQVVVVVVHFCLMRAIYSLF